MVAIIDNNKVQTKQINRIVRPIITMIIVIVLMITIPIISGFAYLIFVIFGQPIAYISCQLILNLYGPLIIIVVITILPIVFRIISMGRFTGSSTSSFVDKKIWNYMRFQMARILLRV